MYQDLLLSQRGIFCTKVQVSWKSNPQTAALKVYKYISFRGRLGDECFCLLPLHWALGWQPVKNHFFVWYHLFELRDSGYQRKCSLGSSRKSQGARWVYKLLSWRHWWPGVGHKLEWRWCPVTSRDDCTQPLDVYLIRSLLLRPRLWRYTNSPLSPKEFFFFLTAASPLCPGYNWLRTPFLFVTVLWDPCTQALLVKQNQEMKGWPLGGHSRKQCSKQAYKLLSRRHRDPGGRWRDRAKKAVFVFGEYFSWPLDTCWVKWLPLRLKLSDRQIGCFHRKTGHSSISCLSTRSWGWLGKSVWFL